MKGFVQAVCLLFLASAAWAAPREIRRAAEPVPDEYIIILRDVSKSRVPEVAQELAQRQGGKVIVTFSNGLRGFGAKLTRTQAETLLNDPRVDIVEENGFGHLSYNVETYPDDRRWHLNRIDQRLPIAQNPVNAYGWT